MADPVERFFEGAVRRNLGPGDTFMRQGELSYILLFQNLSPEEAQVKCRAISEEVCERLFGDQIKSASLRTLVVSLGPDALAGNAISSALNDLLERRGREVIIQVTASKDPAPAAMSRTSKVPDDGADETSSMFLYRPLWDATKNVVLTYVCQGTGMTEVRVGPSARGPAWTESRQAELDLGVLRECAARTAQLHHSSLRILCGVTVDLVTISRSRLWTSYSRELRTIPSTVSRDFAFFVTGIDSGVPNIRLAQELPKLTRLSHQIFCVVEGRGYTGTRFARTGTHAIGITLPPGEAEALSMARIVELAQQACDARLASFVFGLSSTSILLHALGQGIRYLEGGAVRTAVSDPRHAFAQSLEHVYFGRTKSLLSKQGIA